MLVDGNNLAMRSFHAAQGKMSAAGENTGALQLFVNSLSMHVREERPDRLVICWDSGQSTMRLRIYPEYKAARRAKSLEYGGSEPHHELFVMIKRFLLLCGIAQWSREGVEADDLIAAGWRRHRTDQVVILSSDKDLLQLLDANTTQIRFATTGADRWTRERFLAERGFRPEQLPLVMALEGDTSDGVPGMRGIGPKKALKMLVAANWDLDQAMRAYPEHYAIVKTSQALVDLSWSPVEVEDVPEFCPRNRTQFDGWSSLLAFCEHYQLRTIRQRLVGGDLWT